MIPFRVIGYLKLRQGDWKIDIQENVGSSGQKKGNSYSFPFK